MPFIDKLRTAQARTNSWVCLGLDTAVDKLPSGLGTGEDAVLAFNRAIIDATLDLVSAFKPNLAFYLARGSAGLTSLAQTIAAIPREIPIVLDAKFGDIESSARGYARFAFEQLGVDAVTVNPYLGTDALSPFMEYENRAIFILAHTSNPGAAFFQDALIANEPLYRRVAAWAHTLQGPAHAGLVIGATFPDQLIGLRESNPDALLLIPGVGAQGGSLAQAVEFGPNTEGVGPLINASRSILYASGGADFASAARVAALKMRDDINTQRETYA